MTNQEEKKNKPNWLQRNWKILTMNAALFLFGSSHALGKESNDGPNQDRNEFNTEINASDSHENKKLTGKYLETASGLPIWLPKPEPTTSALINFPPKNWPE
ncbi:MAG: hypothetical protein ACLU99_05755 [Alphaproteobacteria bacterium]